MNSTEYEKALAEKLLYEYPPPFFEVIHNLKVEGIYSEGQRQIDVAIRRVGEDHPFLVAEAKLHAATLNIGYIDAFITKIKDVDAKIGIMVVSSNYSKPGERLATAHGIDLRIMTPEEALEMQWRPIARQVFPLDWAFHPDLAAGLHRLHRLEPPDSVIEALEAVYYEEWLAFVGYALAHNPAEADEFLWFVAQHHYDDGWRYNAIQQLDDIGSLDQSRKDTLLRKESDPETIELLRDAGQDIH